MIFFLKMLNIKVSTIYFIIFALLRVFVKKWLTIYIIMLITILPNFSNKILVNMLFENWIIKGCVGGDNSLQHILVTDVTCLCWVQTCHFNGNSNLRVWSWLRTNAGGMLNTCKSNEGPELALDTLVANGWVTRGNLPKNGE